MADYVEHVHCSSCGKRCSGVDPELGLVVRAYVECPECIAAHGLMHADDRGIARMDALGRRGFTVSVCCGPSGPGPVGAWTDTYHAKPVRWSVQVLAPDGQEFERPFAANDFDHALTIAELEIARRRWR